MFRFPMVALLGAFIFVTAGGLTGQDPKKDDPPAKIKGTLPPNWKKLGLSEEQITEIYKIEGKYKPEIDKLQAKIKELKTAQDTDLKAVLTADQKKRLADIVTGDKEKPKDK